MFRVFWVDDIGEDQKGDQGKNGQNFRWGKISRFRAFSSAKKVLETAEKWGLAEN